MKFGTLHQILNPVTVTWPKIEIFKIQDGCGGRLENRFFCHKSSIDCPSSAKFCMRKQNGRSTRATGRKNGGRHFENRKIAISQWKIVRFWWSFVHYIRYWTRLQSRHQKLKFCMRKHNGMPTKATWYKLQVFKIQNIGRPPFWKSLNYHISVKILLDFDKIWHTTACIEPDEVFKSAIAESLMW